MTEPLFKIDLYRLRREDHTCDGCRLEIWDSVDGLRVKGWLVYDGMSQTSQPLHVRICPTCRNRRQGSGTVRRTTSPHAEPPLPGIP